MKKNKNKKISQQNLDNYAKKTIRKDEFIGDLPRSFVAYCYKHAESAEQKEIIKQILNNNR